MRIENTETSGARAVRAVVDQFDGCPPVDTVELGIRPAKNVPPDRLAVAAALLFEPWIAGPLEMPEAVSALVAQRIGRFFGARWVQCEPVRKGALPISRGVRELALVRSDEHTTTRGRDGNLVLAPVTHFSGIRHDGINVQLATNIALVRAGHARGGHLADLGVAVSAAEYFDINVIQHPALYDASPADFDRAADLLEAVGLGLGR